MVSVRRSLAFASSVSLRLVPSLSSFTALTCTYSSPSRVILTTASMMTFASQPTDDDHLVTGYLNAKDASDLDAELIASPGFTLEQLMELAGLSVAQAVYEVTPPTKQKILLVCGPGNNGGDGLVAARHLNLFGHDSVIVYPKRSSKQPHYANLIKTCEDLGIPILDSMPEDLSSFATIVDAIFGFSFAGTPRAPFDHIIQQMMDAQRHYKIPIVAVDVPSGWNVDEGDVAGLGFQPQVLVSLTAPKLCAKKFKGRHFCGGRFLPPILADKYGITMPPYPGTAQIMELTTSDSCVEQEKNYE